MNLETLVSQSKERSPEFAAEYERLGPLYDITSKIIEIRQMTGTRNMLTWSIAKAVAEWLGTIPENTRSQAKKELAGEARVTTRSLEYYWQVWGIVKDLPSAALEMIQFSTARALCELYPPDEARRLIEEVHDSDLSLMRVRVQVLKARLKDEKVNRKQTTLGDALREALGDMWKATTLNPQERGQVQTAVTSVLDEMEG